MPNTITDTITELADNKSDIQDALVAKGVTLAAGHGFNKFAEDISSITNQYTSSDEGKVVDNGELVAQTSTTATANGTINTTTNNEVVVNVPNTYTAQDESKVVSNGALVAQTAYPSTITTNGTINTTTNNSVTVAVPDSVKIGSINLLDNTYTISNQKIISTSNSLYIYFVISHAEWKNTYTVPAYTVNDTVLEITNVYLPNSYDDIKTGSSCYFTSGHLDSTSIYNNSYISSWIAYNPNYGKGLVNSAAFIYRDSADDGLVFTKSGDKLILTHKVYLQSYQVYCLNDRKNTSSNYNPTSVCLAITW